MEKKKKIIFEGVDGSGKTTLIELVKQEFPHIEFADRAFISDRVYAYKFNRETYLGVDIDTYLSFWEQTHANTLDTRIILCEASLDDLAKRAIQKEESFTRNRNFEQIASYLQKDRNYFDFWTQYVAQKNKFPLLKLNTSRQTIEDCLELIKEFIK